MAGQRTKPYLARDWRVLADESASPPGVRLARMKRAIVPDRLKRNVFSSSRTGQAWKPGWRLLQPAHGLHPFANPDVPGSGGQAGFLHAETVAAFGIDVEFGRQVELLVFEIKHGAGAGAGDAFVVMCMDQAHGRRFVGNFDFRQESKSVFLADEVGG